MSKIILVTGGARSGKSSFAERLVRRLGAPSTYIATAEAHDEEMRARIAAHQADRGPDWTTVNAPFDLVGALSDSDTAGARLVDCLTLWLSNVMLADQDVEVAGDALVDCLQRQSQPVVLVTNEVGAGIVPENALARRYRDAAGRLNQKVAQVSDEAFLVAAGCPVRIKPSDTIY